MTSLTLFAAWMSASILQNPTSAATFQWKPNQTLTYRVSQTTTATETLKEAEPMTTTTQLDLVKRWRVVEVDAAGTATLEMSLVSLRMETRPPKAEAMLFDSAHPEKNTDGMREELAKYVGPVLTVVQIDAHGRLTAVKESKFGPESRLRADLPFKLVLPDAGLSVGNQWQRQYVVKLDPPQGAGETYDAVQKYACQAIADGQAVIAMTSEVKNLPESAGDRLPLLPLMPSGELRFDLKSGRLASVRYQFKHDVAGHRGEGSTYTLTTNYSEDLIEAR